MYYAQGDYGKALNGYLKAYRILLARLGAEHPHTKNCRANMEGAYEKTGQPRPFEDWLRQATGS